MADRFYTIASPPRYHPIVESRRNTPILVYDHQGYLYDVKGEGKRYKKRLYIDVEPRISSPAPQKNLLGDTTNALRRDSASLLVSGNLFFVKQSKANLIETVQQAILGKLVNIE